MFLKIKLISKKPIKYIFILCITSLFLLSCSDKNTDSTKIIQQTQITNCPVNGSWCESTINQQKIAILFPKQIPYLKLFPIQVQIKNEDKITQLQIQLQIQLSMQNMQMGMNRFSFKQKNVKSNNQIWNANAILPICVTGRKDWLVELIIKTNKNSYNRYFTITII